MKKEYAVDIDTYRFGVVTPIQVRFNDIDGFGHANNNAMQTYFDLGRAEYLSRVVGLDFYKQDETLLIVSYTTDFMEQVRYGDKVEVRTAVYGIGRRSVKILTALVNTVTGRTCAVSDAVMSGFSKATQQSIEISSEWRRKIGEIEGIEF